MRRGQVGGGVGVAADDGLGQGWMLMQRALPYLRRVGLGVEAETDLPPGLRAEVDEARVVRRERDRPVQGMVGEPRGIAVPRVGVGPYGLADCGDVAVFPALGGRAGDQVA